MQLQSRMKQPGVVARFNQLLSSEPESMATISALMPPSLFKEGQHADVMRSHMTGLICAIGWWWSESKEGDLPHEMPSDFLEASSRSGYASMALDMLGVIGSRLFPNVLPIEDISNSSISAQCALYHWFDLVRSNSPDLSQALQSLRAWLASIGASLEKAA